MALFSEHVRTEVEFAYFLLCTYDDLLETLFPQKRVFNRKKIKKNKLRNLSLFKRSKRRAEKDPQLCIEFNCIKYFFKSSGRAKIRSSTMRSFERSK